MDVLSLQIFVSLVLVLGSVLLFVHAQKGKVHEQADRLALLPLEGDEAAPKSRHETEEIEGASAREERR